MSRFKVMYDVINGHNTISVSNSEYGDGWRKSWFSDPVISDGDTKSRDVVIDAILSIISHKKNGSYRRVGITYFAMGKK